MQTHTVQKSVARHRWQPTDGERYFTILGDGNMRLIRWHATPFDYNAWEFGNCFRTRRDAERAQAVLREVLRSLHRVPDK